ncbi:MAG: hypothetical protein JWM98_2703 [Thermoleophilia bacterium]|nr:hypothetical protein [Thermoleophilia bacterium]
MSIASVVAATPKAPVAAPRVASVDLALNVDDSMSGRPTNLDHAGASAVTRFELNAPAGAELRVKVPDGAVFNAWAWANSGRTGVSFAKDGAEWVAHAKVPTDQISLQTSAWVSRGNDVSVDEHAARIGDITPRLTVDGVAQSDEGAPVTITAPRGWETAAADGTKDVLHDVARVDDTVGGERPAGHGVATTATFTGRDVDGSSALGLRRTAHEAATRVTDSAAAAVMTALEMGGIAP